MAVKIRLRRMGKKGRPFYRVVVADSRSPRDGRFIETIGYYDPGTDPATIKIDGEKALLWLSRGARPTDTAEALLKKEGIVEQFLAAKGAKGRKRAAPAKPPVVEAKAPPVEVEPVVEAEPVAEVEAPPVEVEAVVQAEAPPVEAEPAAATEVETVAESPPAKKRRVTRTKPAAPRKRKTAATKAETPPAETETAETQPEAPAESEAAAEEQPEGEQG